MRLVWVVCRLSRVQFPKVRTKLSVSTQLPKNNEHTKYAQIYLGLAFALTVILSGGLASALAKKLFRSWHTVCMHSGRRDTLVGGTYALAMDALDMHA